MEPNNGNPKFPEWAAAMAHHKREMAEALSNGENPLTLAIDLTGILTAEAYAELAGKGEAGRQAGVALVDHLNRACLEYLEAHDAAKVPVDMAALVAAAFNLHRMCIRAWLKLKIEEAPDARFRAVFEDLLDAYEQPFHFLEAVRLKARAN